MKIKLVRSILLELETVQVDYTEVFLHEKIDKNHDWDKMSQAECKKSGVCSTIPQGFVEPGKVLSL